MSTTSLALAAVLLAGSQSDSTAWRTLDDFRALRQIDEMAVSPDGKWAAYLSAPVFEMAVPPTSSHLTLLQLKDGRTRVIEFQDRPSALRWSSRGILGFLMNGKGGARIWQLAPTDSTAAPRQLMPSSTPSGDVLAFAWSPQGDSLSYIATLYANLDTAVKSRAPQERVLLFRDTTWNVTGLTTPIYERDTLGAQVEVAGVDGKAPNVIRRQVVSWKAGPSLEWLRTGHLGAIGVSLNAILYQVFFERIVTLIDPRSRSTRRLTLPFNDAPRDPAWSPSGRRLAYLHHHLPTMDHRRPLVVYSLRAVEQNAETSRVLFSGEADGLQGGLPPLWSADERVLYIGRYQKGSARLYAIDLATRAWRPLTPDTLSVSRYVLANDGKHLLVVMENANQPREIFRLDPKSGALTRLTHEAHNLARLPVGRVEAVQWPSRDGRFTVHGFLVKPRSYDPARRYPLVVTVHGGPGVFFTNSFMESRFDWPYALAQLLTEAGYLVLRPNPRGDAGYGTEFNAALNGDLASGPFHDVDAGVSALVERGLVDSTSVALYGGSYGGYLTAYAIGQTTRYAAAVIDDGPMNLASIFGQEYALGTMSLRYRLGGSPWARPHQYASQSPTTFADRVRTPVLMRYGGLSASVADAIRMSLLAQGFEFYAGLKEANVPVEFVLHPDQGHGVADWHLYRDWVARTMAWLRRWMPRTNH